MSTHRLFVALELPAEVKDALVRVQDVMRAAQLPVAWTKPETMHLTLVFLGETEAALLPKLADALQGAVEGQHSCTLRLGSPGAFPNHRRPQVLWVGVEGDVDALVKLQGRVAEALEPVGIAREARTYHAHLTLGRVRRDADRNSGERIAAALRAVAFPPQRTWVAEQLILFESQLRPSGPIYTPRATIALERRSG